MKIKIGKEKLSSKLNFKVSNSTTTNLGFVQPSLMLETLPGGKYNLSDMSRVRLTPMVAPSFIDLYLKKYTRAINIEDIFEPFNAFYAGKPYKFAVGTNKVPNIPRLQLLQLFFNLVGYYDNCSAIAYDLVTFDSNGQFISSTKSAKGYQTLFTDKFATVSTKNYLTSAFCAGALERNRVSSDVSYNTYEFNNSLPELTQATASNNADGFDFYLSVGLDAESYSQNRLADVYNVYNCIAIRLGEFGRKLRSIFRGLGIPIDEMVEPCAIARNGDFNNTTLDPTINVLPIIAYAKCISDTFGINKYVDYNQTKLYDLINMGNNNSSPNFSPHYWGQSSPYCYLTDTSNTYIVLFAKAIIEMLRNSFYTLDVDYFSSLNTQVGIQSNSESLQLSSVVGLDAQSSFILKSVSSDFNDFEGDSVNGIGGFHVKDDDVEHSITHPVIINIANKLLHYVNTDNVIGASIAKWFSEKYGISIDTVDTKRSALVGHSSLDINIGTIMSSADTEGASLGDYSGTGYGQDKNGNHCSYTSKSFGFLFQFFCVVPRTSYYQRLEPIYNRYNRFHFFTPEWDSMGFVPVSLKSINAGFKDLVAGLHPRYFDYKFKFDTVNGDMNLNSRKHTMSAYWFNRTISPQYSNKANILTSDDFRRIGKHENLGFYNRIFTDTTPFVDHYLVDFGYNINAHVPMKPIMDSFDTVDEQDNQGSSVTSKA